MIYDITEPHQIGKYSIKFINKRFLQNKDISFAFKVLKDKTEVLKEEDTSTLSEEEKNLYYALENTIKEVQSFQTENKFQNFR